MNMLSYSDKSVSYETLRWVFTPEVRIDGAVDTGGVSRELLREIMDSIQDGVSVLDRELNIKYLNASMRCWYSGQEDVLGAKCHKVFHGRKSPCENCPVLKAIERKSPFMDVVRYTKSGADQGWQELFGVPILNGADEVVGVIEYVRDISFQCKIEYELREIRERFEILEKRNEILSQLLNQREKQMELFEETIIHNMEKFIKPSLDYLKKNVNPNDIGLVAGIIDEIVYPITKKRPPKIENLTSREIQIGALIKEGKTSKEIAAALCISTKAVDFHRANLRKKLGLNRMAGKTNLRSYLLTHL